jgi:2-iminobutanoate/2-iminopropanoate deaminase
MPKTIVSTDKAPAAIGPYSQATRAGNLVFCSGQIAIDRKTGELMGQFDVAEQTRQVLDNLQAVLEAAGAKLSDVVRTTIYLADLRDFATVNAIYAERFGEDPPARATVEVARLPKDAKVEIDAIAYV